MQLSRTAGASIGGKGVVLPPPRQVQASSSQYCLEDEASIDYDSISVDVGTRGNPGPVEYKGVDTQTGEILILCGANR
jgi:ribonuclease HI